MNVGKKMESMTLNYLHQNHNFLYLKYCKLIIQLMEFTKQEMTDIRDLINGNFTREQAIALFAIIGLVSKKLKDVDTSTVEELSDKIESESSEESDE